MPENVRDEELCLREMPGVEVLSQIRSMGSQDRSEAFGKQTTSNNNKFNV